MRPVLVMIGLFTLFAGTCSRAEEVVFPVVVGVVRQGTLLDKDLFVDSVCRAYISHNIAALQTLIARSEDELPRLRHELSGWKELQQSWRKGDPFIKGIGYVCIAEHDTYFSVGVFSGSHQPFVCKLDKKSYAIVHNVDQLVANMYGGLALIRE